MFDPTTRFYLIAAVAAFLVFIVVYSIYISRKIKTYEDYNVAGRSVPIFPLVLTIMGTAIGGSTVLGFTASGYALGIGRSWEILPAYIVVVFVIVVMLKAIRNIGSKYNLVTIPDYTALRYGEKARLPSAIAMLLAYCAITGMQYTAVGTFLHIISGLDLVTGILIGWLILAAKTALGGLKAVIWADSIQGTIQNIGIIILFIFLFVLIGGYAGAAEKAVAIGEPELMNLFSMPFEELLVFLLTLGGYQVIRQDSWQRIWAARDMKIAVSGFWISTIFGFIVTAAIFSLGTFGRLIGVTVEDPSLAFYMISDAVLPAALLVIVITALMATIISCADSNLVAGASSMINDIIKPRLKTGDDKTLLRCSRYAVIATSLVSLILALYIPRLIELWVTGTAMLTSGLMIPVLAALFWKKATRAGGVAAIWGGLVTAVAWQIFGHPFGLHPVYIGVPVSLTLLVTVSLFTTIAPDEPVEELLYKNNRSSQPGTTGPGPLKQYHS